MSNSESVKLMMLQSRNSCDPMSFHEISCIRRKLGKDVGVDVHNTLLSTPTSDLLDDYDGVIIGGAGDFSVHDPKNQSWVTPMRGFLEAILSRNIPAFGICFGHQLLGQVLGSPIATDEARTEVGTVQLELTPNGETDPLFQELPKVFSAQTGHSDHVTKLPHGVTLMAQNNLVKTQAFKVDASRFYSVQFHPDLTSEEALERYFAYKGKLLTAKDETEDKASHRFKPGKDHAVSLLRHFVKKVVMVDNQKISRH